MKNKKISFIPGEISLWGDLKNKIDTYFRFYKIKKEGNAYLYTKTIILLLSAASHYYFLVFFPTPIWIKIILCVSFGANIAFIGFNVMHDGAHGSYSTKDWVNDLMGLSLNFMGGNMFIWKKKHNGNHHKYTNINEADDDIDIRPFIRVHENDKIYWYHRFQHIYWILLYCLTYILWVFFQDFKKYFTGKVGQIKFSKMSMKEHLIFWVSKFIYLGIFLALPIVKVGLVDTLLGYLVFASICGLIIAVVFQLAHVVPDVSFPVLDENNKIHSEWMIHQLSTTADFSPDNRIISWCVGGLNFQIEHHLFPGISHVHYPNIRKIVKKFCDKNSIKHIEYPTFLVALKAHVTYLKKMGRVTA